MVVNQNLGGEMGTGPLPLQNLGKDYCDGEYYGVRTVAYQFKVILTANFGSRNLLGVFAKLSE